MKPTDGPERLEKSVEIGTLCAFYGGLLTPKQLEALRLHYEEDYSLGEIAEQFQVSRQNVHELITRSAAKLRRYEEALGGVSRAEETVRRLKEAEMLIQEAADGLPPARKDKLARAQALIERVVSRQEGEETGHGL